MTCLGGAGRIATRTNTMPENGRSEGWFEASRRDPAGPSTVPEAGGYRAGPRSWIVSLTLAAGFCYLAWLTGCAAAGKQLPWDDNFISYIYSRNLAEGHGLRYNIGDIRPTEGFSSLTHVLVVAMGYAFGMDPLVVTRGLSLACFLLIPVTLGWSLSRLLKTPLPDALAIACASMFPYYLTFATPYHIILGMETILFMGSAACLAAWSLGELEADEAAGRAVCGRALFGSMAVTLVALGRPEGPLLAVLTLALIPLARRFLLGAAWTRRDGAFLAVCAWTVAGLAAYLAWKQWYFGHVLPNPYYVKTRNAIMGMQTTLFPGWPETMEFLELAAIWAALAVPPLLLIRGSRSEIKALLAASLPGLAMVLFFARAIHEAAFYQRYEFPFLVYLNLLPCGAACLLTRRARWLAPVLLAAATIGIAFTELPRAMVRRKPSALLGVRVEDNPSFLVDMGKDLARTRLGRQATIALSAAGAIPYFSGFRAIDIVGLNDPYLSGREPHSIEQVWAYVERQRPDVLQSGLPPATKGIGLDRYDPVLASPQLTDLRQGRDRSELAKYYDPKKLNESIRREMIYIRDRFTFGGVYRAGKSWTILYLRRDSPHLRTIRETLNSSSYALDRTTDLSGHFGNDPRRH